MKLDLNLTDLLNLPTKIMASIALGVGLLLFSPNWLIEKLYMINFREEYGFILGIVFVISFVIFTVSICITFYSYLSNKRANKWFLESASQRLNDLSDYQKTIIFALYQQDNHTGELPIHDGAIHMLEYNMMIQKATTQYAVTSLNNAVFPYFLQPWVINELQKNNNLLDSFQKSYALFESQNTHSSQMNSDNSTW